MVWYPVPVALNLSDQAHHPTAVILGLRAFLVSVILQAAAPPCVVAILLVVDTRGVSAELRHLPEQARIQLVQGRMVSARLTEDRNFQDN